MIKIGITGSLASGKSTVAEIISEKKYPIFNADSIVKRLYKKKFFMNRLRKKFKFKSSPDLKKQIKIFIVNNKKNIKKIETFVHPFVRVELKKFLKKNIKKAIFEIPLLLESKLKKYFDIIIFVAANKKIRLKRYILKGGESTLFEILDNHQIEPSKKIKLCDYVINNNKTFSVLKKSVRKLKTKYE